MPIKPRRTTSPSHSGAALAISAGDNFAVAAHEYLAAMPAGGIDLANYAMRDPGGVVAAATNLYLAVELFFKALYLFNGKPVPHTHDLPTLFDGLPKNISQAVVNCYENVSAPFGDKNATIELVVKGKDAVSPAGSIADHSIHALLSRNRAAYEVWRYAFAVFSKDESVRLRFEYVNLSRLAGALRMQFGTVNVGTTGAA